MAEEKTLSPKMQIIDSKVKALSSTTLGNILDESSMKKFVKAVGKLEGNIDENALIKMLVEAFISGDIKLQARTTYTLSNQ